MKSNRSLASLIVVLVVALAAVFFYRAKHVSPGNSGSTSDEAQSQVQLNSPPTPDAINATPNPGDPANKTSGQPTASATPRSPSSVAPFKFSADKFKAEFPGTWEILYSPSGQAETMAGSGPAVADPNDPNSALPLAARLAPLLGVQADDLKFAENPLQKSPSRVAFRFDQTIQGRPVYQGSLSIFVNLGDNRTSMIQSNLKNYTTIAAGPDLSKTDAASALEKAANRSERVNSVMGPVYYVNDNQTAQPAWVATTKSEGATFEEEVVIDGNTGKALYRRQLGEF